MMSYLLFSIVIQIAFDVRLYQVKRAESFREGFSHLFAEVSDTLKGDFGPLIFHPSNRYKCNSTVSKMVFVITNLSL